MYKKSIGELHTEQIRCKKCESTDCRGCNILRLAQMLEEGKLKEMMDKDHGIRTDSSVVLCRDCKPKWISVTELLPEESEGLNWHEDMILRFTSVWCCDAKNGIVGVRNRLQGKKTGSEYLDQNIKDTDWHWSGAWWEPTHWMPIVPLPEPPKEEA